jgi:hypothetical protein
MNRAYQGGILSIIGRVFAFNALLGVIIFTVAKGAMYSPSPAIAAAAQVATPSAGGVRYDSYPHPDSRGALAFSIPDRWDRTDLTYYMDNCPSTISCSTAQQAIQAAFQSWSELSPLTFREVSDPREADIELGWSNRGPELGYMGDVLAYATFPSDGGDVTFDDSEPWSVFDSGEFDLYLVATHEIGHALGLDHSDDPASLMYPVLTPYTTGLNQTDVNAIQALYGLPDRDDQPTQNIPETADEQVSGQINDDMPYEIWEFEAFAGETLTITMTATSGDLIPYVGLLTNDEETVLAEDQSSDGNTAQVIYTFDQDGTYVIIATREDVADGFTAGSYTLSITTADTETVPPPQTAPSEGDVLVDIRSYSAAEVCEAYISPVESDDWGRNVLAFPLTNGNGVETYFPPGVYDVQVVTCDGAVFESGDVEITIDLALEIYDDGINIYVYGE